MSAIDAPPATPAPAAPPPPSDATVTTLNRSWIFKMVAFMVALFGFGLYGLYDGVWAYPHRGEQDAEYQLRNYLLKARQAGKINDAKVADPRKELNDLEAKAKELASAAGEGGSRGRQAEMDLARLEWLRSLARIWRLDSAPSRVSDKPGPQLDDLETAWKSKPVPKPLSSYDLPFQWLFFAIGIGGSLWLLLVVLRAKTRVFRWDPAQLRLTLPGGQSIVPAEIEEFDKRKWHKFFVTLNLAGGKAVTLDLLRYVPLEEWVLAMERERFPETAATPSTDPAADMPPEVPPASETPANA